MSPAASRERPSRPGSDAEEAVPAEGADDIPVTTLDLEAVGIDAGVWSRPIADTEFRRFFRARKAEDCGRSISSPYRHLYRYG
jgi:hypothetical protein